MRHDDNGQNSGDSQPKFFLFLFLFQWRSDFSIMKWWLFHRISIHYGIKWLEILPERGLPATSLSAVPECLNCAAHRSNRHQTCLLLMARNKANEEQGSTRSASLWKPKKVCDEERGIPSGFPISELMTSLRQSRNKGHHQMTKRTTDLMFIFFFWLRNLLLICCKSGISMQSVELAAVTWRKSWLGGRWQKAFTSRSRHKDCRSTSSPPSSSSCSLLKNKLN